MFKTVLQVLAVAGTFGILTAQFVFDYDYDFHHYLQKAEGRSRSTNEVPEIRWLDNGRCGPRHVLRNNVSAICNPYGEDGCCDLIKGECGSSWHHCYCKNCIDFRDKTSMTSAHTTIPPTGKRNYTVYRAHFADRQCPQIGLFKGKLDSWCREECDNTPGCTAVNSYFSRENNYAGVCSLRACGLDPPYPIDNGNGKQSYSLKPIAKNYTRYNGPQDKYYATKQGCIHLHPTRHNKSYVECEDICDDEAFCIGFNFNLKTFDCEMFYCDDPTIPPEGIVEENWESWAKTKFDEGYNGPMSVYYQTRQGCVHIHPTHENIGHANCEKLCDWEPYCLGFNLHTKTLNCELFYCKNPTTSPNGANLKNWKSYSKRTFRKSVPRLYLEIEKSLDQNHVNDTTCRLIEYYSTPESLAECEHLCDVNHRQCKGFYYNPDVEECCILQTCRHKSPFPRVQGSGWQGYVAHIHDSAPRSYIIYPDTEGKSYTDRQCKPLSFQASVLVISNCKTLCDLTAKCTAFNFNSRKGCVLRACGQRPRFPIGQYDGWQGYALEETKRTDTEISKPSQPITVSRNYTRSGKYQGKYLLNWQCPFLGNYSGKSLSRCQLLCDSTPNCNFVNHGFELECMLYACGNSPPKPLGTYDELIRLQSYSLKTHIREYGAIDVKIIDSSEIYHQPYLGPEMVLDGDNSTFWNPEGKLSSWYITFKLGYRYCNVTSMHLSNYGDGVHDVTQFKLEISYDNVRWYLVLENNVKAGTNESLTFEGFKEAIGNFLRFTVTKTSGYQPWITELGFWGYSREGFTRYDGPRDKYYRTSGSCVQLEPKYRNKTYVECEEYCDNEGYCTGFNLDLATRNCELWFCDNEETTSGAVDQSDIKSWRKKNYRATDPRSYIILPGSEGKSYSDKQCRKLGELFFKGFYSCKRQCDLKALCTAFDFHHKKGCVLRACGQRPPHPVGKVKGWQGYVLEETKQNYGNAWYYGPFKASFSGNSNCFVVKMITDRTRVECEKACDKDPWCTGFDHHVKINPPFCDLYVCDPTRTIPKPAKGIESWSKYEFRARGHECTPGHVEMEFCNICYCYGGRWDCSNHDCTEKKYKIYIFQTRFSNPIG